MSATDELRRMLDERGIAVDASDNSNAVYWFCGRAEYEQYYDGSTRLIVYDATPEQAIAATIGRGACHMVRRYDYVVYDEAPCIWLECDECGGVLPDAFGIKVRYCPNCGRKVFE